MQRRVDAALARDPAARRRIGRRAVKKLQELQYNAETMRATARGDEIRPLVEKRTAAELDKEQAFREADRAEQIEEQLLARLTPGAHLALAQGVEKLNDRPLIFSMLENHGKLISKAGMLRAGRDPGGLFDDAPAWMPPSWFAKSGGITPDEMAQMLYEEGILKVPGGTPKPSDLWAALGGEIKSHRAQSAAFETAAKAAGEARKTARNTAREEAAEWRREQDEMQRKDWSPRAALVRDLRALDAILSVLPPEIRGRIGGFVKLATLGSDQARLAEIGRRIEKLNVELEKWLRKESTAALDALVEKAAPKREAGEQSRGKLGAEAHRYFDRIESARGLSAVEAEGERAKLEAMLASDTLTPEQAVEIFEQQQILDAFGNWKEKSAADMDAALRAAEAVYAGGRNRWRMLEEQRLEEVRGLAEQVAGQLGGASVAGTQAAKKRAATLRGKIAGGALDLKSFAEVLDTLLGENHPVAKRWTRAVREGWARKNDEIRAMRKRWKAALEAATGQRGLAARRALWDMGREQTITVDTAGEDTGGTIRVPIATIEQWADGSLDPADMGIPISDAQRLIAMRAGLPANSRKRFLSLAQEQRAPAAPAQMTEAEGVFLTMLAGQEQYAEALDRAGWTAEALESVEKQLSDAAKKLRQFMRAEYRDGYAPLATVFERMFGVELPQIANYAPAAFYHTGAERLMSPELGGPIEGGVRAGFLKNRKKHTAVPRLENAFATFFGHAEQTAHWKGLAEVTRELSGVLGHPEVKRAIESAHGPQMLKALTQWQQVIEGNGLQIKAGVFDKAVAWFTSQQAYIALSWKVSTIFKQSSALFGAAYRMPVPAYARGFARLLSGQLEFRAMLASPVIQRRLETGYAPEVRAALNDVFSSKPSRRAEIVEKGMELIGFVDAFFTAGSAAIAYDYHHRQALEAGLTGPAAHDAAMREVEDIVARTAQPADAPDRSLFEARQNAFGKLVFLYASEARQKSSLVLTAWGRTLTGQPTPADLRVLAISHLLIGPMMAAITAAWRDAQDDDDDELFDPQNWKPADFARAILAGPFAGVPLIASLLSGFRDEGIFGRTKKAVSAGKSLLEGPRESEVENVEWYADRLTRVMQGMDAYTGVAGSIGNQVFNAADNLFDTGEEAAKKERAAIRRAAKEAR